MQISKIQSTLTNLKALVIVPLLIAGFQNCGSFEAASSGTQWGAENSSFLGTFGGLFSSGEITQPHQAAWELARCNGVSFTQVKGTSLFIGRSENNDSQNNCQGDHHWSLVLYSSDWQDHEMRYVKDVLKTPVYINNGNQLLTSAYDPSLTVIKGQNWLAFECGIHGLGSVQTCVAPLKPDFTIDPKRAHVIVQADPYDPSDEYYHSGSVPKLFTFQDRIYLYWTSVHQRRDSLSDWSHITTRGVELEFNHSQQTLWAKGHQQPIRSTAPQTHEVWSLGQGEKLNRVADIFDVHVKDGVIYATAALGGGNCIHPHSRSEGCYRLAIARSHQPLGENIFNREWAAEYQLPTNPMEYARLFRKPDGSLVLGAHWMNPHSGINMERSVSTGYRMFSFDPSQLRFVRASWAAREPDPVEKGCSSGQLFVDGVCQTPQKIRYLGTDRRLGHLIGQNENASWSASVLDGPGYLSYGPYAENWPQTTREVVFHLAVDNNSIEHQARIVKVDIYDATTSEVVAERVLWRTEMARPFTSREFSLPFSMQGRSGHKMEARVYAYGHSYIRLDSITVK